MRFIQSCRWQAISFLIGKTKTYNRLYLVLIATLIGFLVGMENSSLLYSKLVFYFAYAPASAGAASSGAASGGGGGIV